MLAFVVRRILSTIATLVVVSLIVFVVAQVLPGDVGRTILGPYATKAQTLRIDHQLGVDRPVISQYLHWLGQFIQGRWGTSYTQGVAVRPLVLSHFGHSLILGALAFILVVPLSIGLGVLAALKEGRFADRAISVAGLSLIAIPEFVSGVLLLYVFTVELHWFPVVARVPSADPIDILHQLLLPAIPVMLLLFGYISRMARAGTIEALRANYTRTAVLKGLPRRVVLRSHVLRNAMVPTIAVTALQFGYMVGGLAVTETLFSYPGIGKLAVDSATSHDIPVLEACVLMMGVFFMVINLIADVAYALLNPRIRVGAAS
jgi:peptide/nickel transport system permease protein